MAEEKPTCCLPSSATNEAGEDLLFGLMSFPAHQYGRHPPRAETRSGWGAVQRARTAEGGTRWSLSVSSLLVA
jgi:hypothetical protein